MKYVEAIEQHWNLDMDSEIGQKTAATLNEIRRGGKVIRAVAQGTIQIGTPLSVYDDCKLVEQAALQIVSVNAGVFELIGRALNTTPHWQMMFNHVLQNLKAYKEHLPSIQANFKVLAEMKNEPSEGNKAKLASVVENIPIYCASIGADACPELETQLVEMVRSHGLVIISCATGLASPGDSPTAATSATTPLDLLDSCLALFKKVIPACKVGPSFEFVHSGLKDSKSAKDEGLRKSTVKP